MVKKRGLFIVLDGIDGGGKSTQAEMLRRFFEEKGKEVLLTHEPSSKTKTGKKIKKLVKSEEGKDMTKEEWVSLFNRERKGYAKEVKKALNMGKVVISDRYYYSTLAYQLEKGEWKAYARRFPKPDAAIILDIPIKTSMRRIEKKNREEGLRRAIFENEMFLKKTRKKFLDMKTFKEARFIDGNKSREKVLSAILKVKEIKWR